MSIEVKNLTKTFHAPGGDVHALDGINFKIKTGSFVSIIGKSGSGKSTLLSQLGALDQPTSGEIVVDGTDITRLSGGKQTAYRSKKIGFVFQQYNLIPNLTALENVMLGLEFGGVPAGERKERALELLELVGIDEDQARRRPAKLSGGQQQRVSIARALGNEPAFILADEPTGNLDSKTGETVIELLFRLNREHNTTLVVVTHDHELAQRCQRQLVMAAGRLA